MSNFSVNGVTYTDSMLYSYLGRIPSNSTKLERAFNDHKIVPTGSVNDLRRLKDALYNDYSAQVQEQMKNQEEQQATPWSGVCAQIGLRETGNLEEDQKAFFNALGLLEQNAMDGQSMSYFASLRLEAKKAFGINTNNNNENTTPNISYYQYLGKVLY